jgi:hypothetical protein
MENRRDYRNKITLLYVCIQVSFYRYIQCFESGLRRLRSFLSGSGSGMISKLGPESERISFRIYNVYRYYTILLLDVIIYAVHSMLY